MSLQLITDATFEPVALAVAKAHLRVDGTDDDDYIDALISSARESAEHVLGRALCTQTWERTLDAFPSGAIKLGHAPVVSITSITYVDGAGATQTLSGGAYVLDTGAEPGVVRPAYGTDWPAALDTANAVRVRYVCGYAADACPKSIQSWMLLHIGNLYRNREVVVIGQAVAAMPSAPGLLDRYRVYGL